MKGFTLTTKELEALHKAHKAAKRTNAKAAYKINAVILLGSGWTLKKVRSALLLDEETLRSYVEKYRDNGIDTLLETKHNSKVMADAAFISTKSLVDNSFINGNVEDSILTVLIDRTQRAAIEPLIGTSLYNPIENQLHALKNARVLGQRLGHKVNHLMARGVSAEAV